MESTSKGPTNEQKQSRQNNQAMNNSSLDVNNSTSNSNSNRAAPQAASPARSREHELTGTHAAQTQTLPSNQSSTSAWLAYLGAQQQAASHPTVSANNNDNTSTALTPSSIAMLQSLLSQNTQNLQPQSTLGSLLTNSSPSNVETILQLQLLLQRQQQQQQQLQQQRTQLALALLANPAPQPNFLSSLIQPQQALSLLQPQPTSTSFLETLLGGGNPSITAASILQLQQQQHQSGVASLLAGLIPTISAESSSSRNIATNASSTTPCTNTNSLSSSGGRNPTSQQDLHNLPPPLSAAGLARAIEPAAAPSDSKQAGATVAGVSIRADQVAQFALKAKKPKRPLTAYNFFFRDERANLLVERESVYETDDYDWTKRKGRSKPHGKIKFNELGRVIGKRWKECDPDTKRKYEELAAEDKQRYRKEMSEYKTEENKHLEAMRKKMNHPGT